jgi:hypothetical protein
MNENDAPPVTSETPTVTPLMRVAVLAILLGMIFLMGWLVSVTTNVDRGGPSPARGLDGVPTVAYTLAPSGH